MSMVGKDMREVTSVSGVVQFTICVISIVVSLFAAGLSFYIFAEDRLIDYAVFVLGMYLPFVLVEFCLAGAMLSKKYSVKAGGKVFAVIILILALVSIVSLVFHMMHPIL